MNVTTDAITSCLENVIDPELGINVVDLGLIYNVLIDANKISVDMTLTTPGCPMAGMLAGSVEQAVRQTYEGADVEVSLIWDPPWTPDRLSEAARQQLGYTR